MALRKIDAVTAFKKVRDGKQIFILQPISRRTTIEDMADALAFAEEVSEDAEIVERLKKVVAENTEPKKEEVAEQTEAPAMKRKRGRPASLDTGKIMSLYRAGWTVESIAKEVDAPVAKIRAITMQEDL